MPENDLPLPAQASTHEGSYLREGSYLERRLIQDGIIEGKDAFESLCRRGCDPDILAELLSYLCESEPIELDTTRPDGSPVRVLLSPLDSLESALNGLTVPQLESIVNRARALKEDIHRLKETSLVRHLIAEGLIADGDLLAGSPVPEVSDSRFNGLLSLPALARQCGSKQRPEYTRRRLKIHEHVRERTGTWHDKLVADIFGALFPDPEARNNEHSIKEWRRRHDLHD